MNNIEKKLDALIDALGFDVEKITDFNVADYERVHKGYIYCRMGFPPPQKSTYTNVEYKLTKRAPERNSLPHDAWCGLVDFILSHQEDIVHDVNGYGGLGAVLDWFYRNTPSATKDELK